jgi:PST family polysaccharide transporter
MTTLAHQAVRGTMAVFVSNTVSRLVSFFGGLYLMDKVAAPDFGVVAYAASLLAIADAFCNWGFSQAATHRQDRVEETFSTFLVLRVAMLFVVFWLLGIGGALSRSAWIERPQLDIMYALAVALLADAACDVRATWLARSMRFGRLMVVDIAAVVLATGCAVLLAALGVGIWALAANRFLYSATRMVGLGLLGAWSHRLVFYAQDARWLFRFGFPLWLGSLATTWVLNYDDLMVGDLCGEKALGFYDRACALGLLPLAFITGVLTRVSFPLYARLQGDRARLSEAFRIVSGTTLRLAGPMAVGLALAIPDFLAVMRWKQWEPMTPIFRWLLIYAILRPLMDDAGGLLTAIGRPKITGHTLVVEALALVVLCPLFTRSWGAEGAAASVGLVVLGGLGTWYVVFLPRVLDVSYVRLLVPPLVSLGAAGAVGVAVQAWGGLAVGLSCGAAKLAAVAAVYVAGMFLLEGRQTLADLRALWRHARGKGAPDA